MNVINVITQINEQCLCRLANLSIDEARKGDVLRTSYNLKSQRRECHSLELEEVKSPTFRLHGYDGNKLIQLVLSTKAIV